MHLYLICHLIPFYWNKIPNSFIVIWEKNVIYVFSFNFLNLGNQSVYCWVWKNISLRDYFKCLNFLKPNIYLSLYAILFRRSKYYSYLRRPTWVFYLLLLLLLLLFYLVNPRTEALIYPIISLFASVVARGLGITGFFFFLCRSFL